MTLSDGEKLILVMLADLSRAMKVGGDVDPEFVRSTIHSGHLWGLKWQYPDIFGADATLPEVVRETCDILTMWQVLERSYGRLSEADRARVSSEAAPVGQDVRFAGFEANEEPHFGVATHLVEKLGRFDEFAGRDLNSHAPSIDMHRRMLTAFNLIRSLQPQADLEPVQIVAVLQAQMKPEERVKEE